MNGTIDYNNKGAMHFISIIRLPDFVTKADFNWAIEEATKKKKQDFSKENGYEVDITDKRLHHEIYLSDPRKCDVSKLKTVVRHPIKKI